MIFLWKFLGVIAAYLRAQLEPNSSNYQWEYLIEWIRAPLFTLAFIFALVGMVAVLPLLWKEAFDKSKETGSKK